ncbi:hypothetical protein PHJA_000562900 [Phtheirospermum japonicum]|uniref:Uncharacterized protein n=1 Tax=Phtheirospermum japonicum TaxID=374723 RepID=A0A830BDI4_9LAMI|nr:hypothetical protein PHJA_000562900 [Phtheirospermum japonicum]
MIARLSNLFLYPAFTDKNPTFCHIPQLHTFSETHFFRNFEPLSNNRKLYTSKSSAHTSITLSNDGIPRVAKTDAQAALFDYLHCTRGLSFLDAEHISKNSPRFVADLIAKVEKEQDVSRALSKFFRYHPINEFEPFFESLGLSPPEFTSLLPRGLIFLSDDQLLLDNFRTLSDYGVPRSKIGKMYLEVNELFRYEIGVLDTKLRAYENLGLSRSTVIKLVTCSPLLLVGEVNIAFATVLEKLKELGLNRNWIAGYVSSKNTYNWNRILDTLCFLREVGYDDSEMGVLLRKDTALLFHGSGKDVYAVVGALLKLGLNMNEVYGVVSKNPQILSPKFAKNFWKALHFLFEIGMDVENTAKILSTHMRFFDSHSLKGPKTVLRNFNGCKHSLCEAIKDDPLAFFNLAFKSNSNSSIEYADARNPNHFVQKQEFLQRIGYIENSEEMLKALKRFRGRGDQLQERFDCLVGAGLDFSTVSGMVKQAPTVLNQTKEILGKKIECLKSYLGYPVESIVGFPSYLCYDMERISVRFSMYKWLRDKGAAKPMISVSTLLACSDARFVKYFVGVHPEGPAAWEDFKKLLSSS